MKELGKCVAPIEARSPSHREYADSIDHFTGRAIGKQLGWTHEELNLKENLQPLCSPCHVRKDRDTCLRIEVLKMQQAGVVFSFEEHRKLFPL